MADLKENRLVEFLRTFAYYTDDHEELEEINGDQETSEINFVELDDYFLDPRRRQQIANRAQWIREVDLDNFSRATILSIKKEWGKYLNKSHQAIVLSGLFNLVPGKIGRKIRTKLATVTATLLGDAFKFEQLKASRAVEEAQTKIPDDPMEFEIPRSQKQVTVFRQQTRELAVLNEKLQTQNQDLVEEVGTLRQQLVLANQRLTTCDEIAKSRDQLAQDRDQLKFVASGLNDQITVFENQIEKLQREAEEKDTKIIEINTEKKRAQDIADKLNRKGLALAASHTELQKTCAELEKRNEILANEIQTADAKLREEIAICRQQNNRLLKENSKFNNKLVKMQEEEKKITLTAATQNAMAAAAKKDSALIKKQLVAECKRRIKKYEEEVKSRNRRIIELNVNNTELRERLKTQMDFSTTMQGINEKLRLISEVKVPEIRVRDEDIKRIVEAINIQTESKDDLPPLEPIGTPFKEEKVVKKEPVPDEKEKPSIIQALVSGGTEPIPEQKSIGTVPKPEEKRKPKEPRCAVRETPPTSETTGRKLKRLPCPKNKKQLIKWAIRRHIEIPPKMKFKEATKFFQDEVIRQRRKARQRYAKNKLLI